MLRTSIRTRLAASAVVTVEPDVERDPDDVLLVALAESRMTVPEDSSDALGAPQILFDSGDGLPDRADLPVGTHTHHDWAFEQPGDYQLVFETSGRLADDGTRVSSGHVTLAFEVRR